MHLNGQNRKKWRKLTPIIFWFYTKICPPTFSEAPWGWENDIFSKNLTCLIWRNIFPESLMPHGQFAILVTSGHLFKTVMHFGPMCLRNSWLLYTLAMWWSAQETVTSLITNGLTWIIIIILSFPAVCQVLNSSQGCVFRNRHICIENLDF